MAYYLHHHFPTGIKAFSTERSGGYSRGAYASFNCNPYCGDDIESVGLNLRLLCSDLDISSNRLFLPKQVHGTDVLVIDEQFLTTAESKQKDLLYGIDALITTLPNCCIAVSTADCVPILLYDKRTSALAAIHAGWRGTLSGIVVKVLQKMKLCYSTQAEDVVACIGPSISLDAFEVGDEVYDSFHNSGFPMNRIACRKAKWHINLWEANRWLLQEYGLHDSSIEISGICTYKAYERFFSARRLGIRSGRIVSGIMRVG